MSDLFGAYQSQSTRQLARIDSSKYPDTNKDFEANMRRVNGFVDYIASYLQQMQKGVDQANQDPITRIRDFATNLGVLFGGGELLYGINMGDLQYFLPALGAIFGFDSSTPFPLNLFYAVEHLFLGYIIPLDSWAFAVEDIMDGFLTALGISPSFIASLHELLEAIQGLTNDIGGLFSSIFDLFGVFGVSSDGGGFGFLGEIWHAITQLLGGFNIADIGNLTDPIFDALAPWIHELAMFIGWLDSILKAFSGGLSIPDGLIAVAQLFNPLNLLVPGFDGTAGWAAIADAIFLPFNILLGPNSGLNSTNLFGFINSLNIPFVHIGAISNTPGPNLLVEPGFDALDAIAPGSGWVRDAGVGRTVLGCAKASANSILRELESIAIPVAEGESISLGAWVQWSGLAYTGTNPIDLTVNAYSGLSLVSRTSIATQTSPATNQFSWLNFFGSYTVPAGCDTIRLCFRVKATVTAGSIWWDDATLSKPTVTLPQDWIFNLIPSLDDIRQFVTDVIDAIIGVIRGIPFVGGGIADLLTWVGSWFDDTQASAAQAGDALLIATTVEPIVYNTVQTVTVVQSKAITQQNYSISSATDSPRQPSYVCKYPISDVSYPEAWNSIIEVFGTTEAASAGTAHTHALNQSNHVYSTPAGYFVTNGNSRGVFLNITNTTAFDHMRLYAWVPTGTATDVTYGLHRVRADGSSYEIVSAVQIASQLTNTGNYIDVDLGGTLIVQAGETYLLRITNRSAAGVAVAAISQTTGANYNGFATTGLTLSNATSYTAAQIATGAVATGQMNFGGLFRAAGFYTPKTYTDDFNRPDFGVLWIPWSNSFGAGAPQLHINFNAGEGRAAFTGTVDGDESNVYMYPSASDQTMVAADTWGLAGTARCGIFTHASREAHQLAYLGVGLGGANLYTGAWGTLGAAKATIASSAADGTNWGIYVDSVPTHDVFYIMKNGTDVASWTDTADTMQVGSDFRYGGKIISRISGVNAGELDNWTMKDVA